MFRALTGISALLIASLACSIGSKATPMVGGPAVTITDPLPDQTFSLNEPIVVSSTSVDTDGVRRVELWVDEIQVRVDNNPGVSSPYLVSQPWQSGVPGTHTIVVKAFDAQGLAGQSQPVIITLHAGEPATEETPAAAASPTLSEETASPAPVQATRLTAPPPSPTRLAPTPTVLVMCTPPACDESEVTYCPGDCPGGCGTTCATPTPALAPPAFEPTGIETHPILKPVWEQPRVRDYLGYATGAASADRRFARQYFERGYLYWWDRPDARGLIWVVETPQPAANQGFRWSGPYEDTWDGGDPYSCDAARANPNGPVAGFGRLWCDQPEIAEAIGTAREPERGTGESTNYGVVQFFQGGVMLYSPLDHEVWVLLDGGTWQKYPR